MHFKSNPLLNQTQLNVDRENGIVKNVSIVEEGANKNGTYFSEKYLDALATGANEIKAGVKSRFGHPNMCSSSLGSYVGRYKNFQFDGKKVTGDLHLDPITKKTQVEGKGISMFEYIMDMAGTNPDMFGNSIHIPRPVFEKKLIEIENEKYDSHIFNGIIASDIVDDPAATSGLFDTNDLGVVMTQFLDENPQVFEVVQKDPSIIEDFFERYSTYSKNFKTKIDMSFLDKFKKKIGMKETFDIDETLADGAIITIKTEDETPKVGDSVVDAEGNALADGDHVIKDGSTIVTESGLITEIKEKEEEGSEDEEPTPAEMMSTMMEIKNSLGKFQKQYKKDLKENQKAIVLAHDDMNKKFKAFKKTVKSSSPDYKAEQPKKKKKFSTESAYDPDAVKAAREARKNQNQE